jgi:hypothetical protein
MLFDCSIVSHVFSLWIANKDVSVMQTNFVDFQNMMSFIYSEQCRRKFVRHIIEDIEYSVPLATACNCDNCIDDDIHVRDMAPAMHMLLSAFQHYGEPVCISRVADALFAHAPKHKERWSDKQTPMWGKGATLFRPSKQANIWSSLAAVAVHELHFLQATLGWHVAPTGNHVVYQRLSLTTKGASFLSESTQTLLIRERFVPVAAWEVIASRCSVDGCTNKAKGPGSVCAKHKADAASQSTALEHVAVKTAASTLSQCTPAVFQPSSGSQCTPPGYQTQVSAYMSQNSSFVSQVSLVPTQPHTETYTFAATRCDNQQSASKSNQKH